MPARDSTPPMSGSIPLFRVAGITVHLHWTWLLVAAYQVQSRADQYGSLVWNVAEYLALFGIVLLHEFGHALACRSVGGRADHIVLWPLGGVAFVAPPPRPGAVLWSIAAGPLVNVILLPVTIGLFLLAASQGLRESSPDVYHFLLAVAFINGLLLVFNLLPVYPLDGGQIVQAILWFFIGRARSLLVVSVIGLVVGAAAVVVALWQQEIWYVILAAFVVLRSLAGFQQARLLAQAAEIPRRADFACPYCGAHPPAATLWRCGNCRTQFDMFEQQAVCPGCHRGFPEVVCPDCQ
ncbi:MAG: M50 family metallopeptidase, partial [Zavarzinella sp.]|nr:M50 family metallopeptidase [Zavarzinella sp.]